MAYCEMLEQYPAICGWRTLRYWIYWQHAKYCHDLCQQIPSGLGTRVILFRFGLKRKRRTCGELHLEPTLVRRWMSPFGPPARCPPPPPHHHRHISERLRYPSFALLCFALPYLPATTRVSPPSPLPLSGPRPKVAPQGGRHDGAASFGSGVRLRHQHQPCLERQTSLRRRPWVGSDCPPSASNAAGPGSDARSTSPWS